MLLMCTWPCLCWPSSKTSPTRGPPLSSTPMPIPEFKIEVGAVTGLPDGAMISFNGPIDARNIKVFETQMNALQERHFRRFLLQMGEVRYINSTGLAYLINFVESIQAAGGALVLFNVQPKVKVILDTM